MKRRDTAGRQLLVARMKSVIASAAIAGTVGGWVAFAGQQASTAAETSAVTTVSSANVSGVAAATGLQTTVSTIRSTAAASTTVAQPQALATTRSSR
jgi:hypothetical protein